MNFRRSISAWSTATFLSITLCAPLIGQEAKLAPDPARWEKEVAAYEAREKAAPSPKGGILFSGSSTIRLWDLKKSFPDLPVINCGIGGSIIPDNTHFAERLIFPYEPKLIVFYCGDNDTANKHTPDQVLSNFEAYVAKVRTKLPKTPILFLSIKPSAARWKLLSVQQEANAKVKALCEKSDGLGYIDLAQVTVGADGQPRREVFQKDGLHLNEKGYEELSKIVRKEIEARLKSAVK